MASTSTSFPWARTSPTATSSAARRRRGGRRRPGLARASPPDSARRSRTPRCAAILVTHGDIDHVGGVAELAEATGAPVHMPAAERRVLEQPERLPAAGCRRRRFGRTSRRSRSSGDEQLELGGHRAADPAVPGHTAGHLAYRRRRLSLLRRRPLRGLGRPLRPAGGELGRAPGLDPDADGDPSARDDRVPGPRPGDDARARAGDEPVPRPSSGPPRREDPGAARHARRPAGGPAALGSSCSTRPARPPRSTGTGSSSRPTFEDTELFTRTSGQGSDVVQKEMYTFEDRSGRLADAAARGHGADGARLPRARPPPRAAAGQDLHVGPMYRYAAPQKGGTASTGRSGSRRWAPTILRSTPS